MAGYSEFIRMYKLVQFVTQKNKLEEFPTRVNLLKFLEDQDYKISDRTLDNDLARIRADFRTELIYSKKNHGYYIDKDKSNQYDSFFRFVEIAALAEIFNKSLKDNNKILEYVSFDDSKSFYGIDNLKEILIALSQKKKLHFKHLNFSMKTLNNYTITPLLLKEYENRWFVLGIPERKDEIWTFGIDRIQNISIGKNYKIDKNKFVRKIKKYDDIIGVSFEHGNQRRKKKIELLIDQLHVNYLESLPLHHSQEIDNDIKEGKQKVTYFLIPNYEFKTQILKMGDYAEVISPIELREDITKMLEGALKNYK